MNNQANATFRQRDNVCALRSLLKAGVGAWLLCAAAALILSGAARMTAPAGALALASDASLASAVVIFGSLILSRLMLSRMWSRSAGYVLAALGAVMCIGIMVNLKGWCPEGDLMHPRMPLYSSDSGREWHVMESMATGAPMPWPANTGYPLTILWLLRIFGGGILTAASFSAFCMVLTASVAGAVTAKLLPALDTRKAVVAGAAMFALVPSIEWYGTLAMKEGAVCLGFALCIYGLASLHRGGLGLRSAMASAVGILLLLMLKSPMAWFLLAGVVLFCVAYMVCRRSRLTKSMTAGAVYLIVIACMALVFGSRFRVVPDTAFVGSEDAREVVQNSMFSYESVQSYARIIGNFYTDPVPVRIAKLPLAAAAQYFPPFPWNFTRDESLGRFVPWAHIPLWYVIGGCILAYYALCVGRRNRSASLGAWSLWVALCWVGIAYASAGSVARYWLPLLPAMVPLGVQALSCVRRGLVSKRVAAGYSVSYVLLLGGGLCSAYIFLNS